MIRQSVYIRIFGNIKIKIWSYPKDVLKSLICSLKRNSDTLHRVTDLICFRHCYAECYTNCNCSDKVEDICLKFSINARRYGKIYVPLEILDCDSNKHVSFICELRCIPDTKNDCINVVNECHGSPQCLLKLISDITNNKSGKERNQSDCEQIKDCYENIIKDLLCDNNDNEKPNSIDKCQLLKLSLKYDLPYSDLLCLLKELNRVPKKVKECSCFKTGNLCRPCEMQMKKTVRFQSCDEEAVNQDISTPTKISTANSNRYVCSKIPSPCTRKGKNFRMIRTPSPNICSSDREDESEISPSISPDFCSNDEIEFCNKSLLKSKFRKWKQNNGSMDDCSGSSQHFQKDISEIKCILKDLMCIMNTSDPCVENKLNCCKEKELDPCCVETKPICCPEKDSNTDILNCILQILRNRKKTKNVPCCNSPCCKEFMKEIDNKCCEKEEDPCQKAKKSDPCCSGMMNIPLIDDSRSMIYRYLPQQIPVIPKLADKEVFTTLDAYEYPLQGKDNTCLETPKVPINVVKEKRSHDNSQAQCDVIKNALESAGVPKSISDKISKISPTHGSTGVTNIYYYVGDSKISGKNKSRKTGSEKSEPDIIVEHKRLGKDKSDPHSHIVVDINNMGNNSDSIRSPKKTGSESKEDKTSISQQLR